MKKIETIVFSISRAWDIFDWIQRQPESDCHLQVLSDWLLLFTFDLKVLKVDYDFVIYYMY